MTEMPFSAKDIQLAMASPRFAALARAGVDLATWQTWDPMLPRNQRVLVPMDVQAYVVPTAQPEPAVAVASFPDDPAPFDPGAPRPAGVHLHWALPDALLHGTHDTINNALVMPRLPDRWVVVRTLLPDGSRTAYASGWVVDAVHAVVVPLATYAGTIDPSVVAASTAPVLDPLDGAARGTLTWSATYEGARNRFTLHDPLADLAGLKNIAPQGFHRNIASYTVAGWWTDPTADPLAAATDATTLDRVLASLGWYITGDGDAGLDMEFDPKLAHLMRYSGLKSPESQTTASIVTEYSDNAVAFSSVAPKAAVPVELVDSVLVGRAQTAYHSLVHGSVMGVPIDGTASGSDDRPDAGTISGSMGLDLDDIAAALAAPGLGLDQANRHTAEQLAAAFTGDLLSRIGTADGLSDLEEREHSDGFWGLPGTPVPGAKPDRLRAEDTTPMGPTKVGRKGRADQYAAGFDALTTQMSWRTGVLPMTTRGAAKGDSSIHKARDDEQLPHKAGGADAPASRSVTRAAPRSYRPAPVMVGLRGIHPSTRHHGDGLFDSQGLRCRYPGEAKASFQGTLSGATILPTLGNGAIPAEVVLVVREAIVYDGYSWRWLADAATPPGADSGPYAVRIVGEMTRLYGTTAIYDGSGVNFVAEIAQATQPRAAAASAWSSYTAQTEHVSTQVASEFGKFSIVDGTPPSPVAITTWRQPWVPLWVEWQVRLDGSDTLDGWTLQGGDLEPGESVSTTLTRTFTGRSSITTGIGSSLTSAIDAWLAAEKQRDATVPSQSQLDDIDEQALGRLADFLRPLDVVSISLDGVREQLLGIPYVGALLRERDDQGVARPSATDLPTPLFGGTLTVEKLRAVDAFGRVLDLPVDALATTTTLEVADQPSTVRLRPRIQHSARWLSRLVDPGYALADDPAAAPEAYVDQLHAPLAVTPISGFLLPDHIDEALEIFDRDGNPLGQVQHDSVTTAVTWETAPGRPLPPDAGPLADIPAHAQHAALLAAGLIEADVSARHGDAPPTASSLSALLRAIDSTLWAVDTYAAIGSPTIAGLVGRPIAVVRLVVTLETPDDLDEVTVTAAGGADARRGAFAELDEQLFPLRAGELGRSDDGVLGFFVDDDYTAFHVVDQVVASGALASGPHTGHLGLLGETPKPDPIDHPYLVLEDTLLLRPGHPVRLTVLMLPAGKMHLTSGILPRKSLELADDWVTPGLSRVVPSMRAGPLLVDPAEIRLPNVASLGKNQVFTRRTGMITWRDDPILASTTNAYLPKMPHEVQEGWIRVGPDTKPGEPA